MVDLFKQCGRFLHEQPVKSQNPQHSLIFSQKL